jgi:hypothetical protein
MALEMSELEAGCRPARTGGLLRGVGLAVVGVASLFATSILTSRGLPYPDQVWHRKLEHLARGTAGEVDTVFVGSSLVYRHVDPVVFDGVVERGDEQSKSFNLGLPGMTPLELDFVIERLVRDAPDGLRRVWISPPRLSIDTLPDANVPRTVNLHDVPRIVRVLELIRASDLPPRRKLRVAAAHTVVTLRNVLRVGTGYEGLRRVLTGTAAERQVAADEREAEFQKALGPNGDGYSPLEEAGGDPALERRARNWARGGRRDFARGLREYRQNGRTEVPMPGGLDELLTILTERVRDAGWEPVFFTHPLVLPDLPQAQYVQSWAPTGEAPAPIVFDFTDPDGSDGAPELFDPELHFDLQHLNARGARLFTESLAQRYLARDTGR